MLVKRTGVADTGSAHGDGLWHGRKDRCSGVGMDASCCVSVGVVCGDGVGARE